MMNWSASSVNFRTSTNTAPRHPASTIAPVGAPVRGSTRAIAFGNTRSSAMAKKIRGAVIMEPLSVPKVLTATAAEREAEQHQRPERAHLERRAHVLQDRGAMDADVVHDSYDPDVRRGEKLLGADRLPSDRHDRARRIHAQDSERVCRRGDGDRAVGAGADDQQLPPTEQERGTRAERLTDEHG